MALFRTYSSKNLQSFRPITGKLISTNHRAAYSNRSQPTHQPSRPYKRDWNWDQSDDIRSWLIRLIIRCWWCFIDYDHWIPIEVKRCDIMLTEEEQHAVIGSLSKGTCSPEFKALLAATGKKKRPGGASGTRGPQATKQTTAGKRKATEPASD
jgi:hypothetical protein